MVQLITYKYFRNNIKDFTLLPPANRRFQKGTKKYIKQLYKEGGTHAVEEAMSIILEIEGIPNGMEVNNHENILLNSKFVNGTTFGLDDLSTGCKAALNVWHAKQTQEKEYIDITEAGSVALTKCIMLLNDTPTIIGTLGAATLLDIDDENLPFTVQLKHQQGQIETTEWDKIFEILYAENNAI